MLDSIDWTRKALAVLTAGALDLPRLAGGSLRGGEKELGVTRGALPDALEGAGIQIRRFGTPRCLHITSDRPARLHY